MQYTSRDLRAADLFGIVLIGFGLVLLVIGSIAYATLPDTTSEPASNVSKTEVGKPGAIAKDSKQALPPGVAYIICGFTLSCLGAALSFKVRQLIRTGGVEPSEYGEAAGP